jgi:uncharacterized protein with HEPN domain
MYSGKSNMSRSPIEYLRHILDEIDYVESIIPNMSEERFLADQTLQRSFARSIEIIGEAAKKIPADFKSAHNEIDWKRITGMRDKLIHVYFGVDYHLVWDVATNKLPELKDKITRIINREKAE